MLKYLAREDWVIEITKNRPLLLNEQPSSVTAIAENFHYEPKYLVFIKKNRPIISFIAFIQGSKIKAPIHFFYSAFWVDPSLSDTAYCNHITEFINELQKDFLQVSIRLPYQLNDVRPFLWKGFSVENKYTYIKKLDNFSYADDVNKNIRDLEKMGYRCIREDFSNELLALNLGLFRELQGYPERKISQIKKLFNGLDPNLVYCFSCYHQDRLITSHMLLIDPENKIAYTVFISKIDKKELEVSRSVHSLSYDKMFRQLKDDGYENVDLLGANIASISAFKAKFDVSLRLFFVVDYSRRKAFFENKKQQAIRFAKRILSFKI